MYIKISSVLQRVVCLQKYKSMSGRTKFRLIKVLSNFKNPIVFWFRSELFYVHINWPLMQCLVIFI